VVVESIPVWAFGAVAILIPATAVVFLLFRDAGIAERHHTHHDTYLVANTLIWSLVFALIFMGALGALLGWLCIIGVFQTRAETVLAFFDSFLVVSFIYWLLLRRYKVVTYEDRLEVTPFMGKRQTIAYSDISALEWAPSLIIANGRNVRVFVGHRRRALLWSALDLEQILIRINRFDVLENG
jgi:hypothetical protein